MKPVLLPSERRNLVENALSCDEFARDQDSVRLHRIADEIDGKRSIDIGYIAKDVMTEGEKYACYTLRFKDLADQTVLIELGSRGNLRSAYRAGERIYSHEADEHLQGAISRTAEAKIMKDIWDKEITDSEAYDYAAG